MPVNNAWRRSGVFIINLFHIEHIELIEHISHLVLFLLVTLNMLLTAGNYVLVDNLSHVVK